MPPCWMHWFIQQLRLLASDDPIAVIDHLSAVMLHDRSQQLLPLAC